MRSVSSELLASRVDHKLLFGRDFCPSSLVASIHPSIIGRAAAAAAESVYDVLPPLRN